MKGCSGWTHSLEAQGLRVGVDTYKGQERPQKEGDHPRLAGGRCGKEAGPGQPQDEQISTPGPQNLSIYVGALTGSGVHTVPMA